jgi:membrane-associated phospholipid phosphatase
MGPRVQTRVDDWDGLNAVDLLNITFIALLTVLVARFRQRLGEDAVWLLGTFAILVLFIGLSALLSSRRPFRRIVHDYYPAFLLPVLFNTLGPIIDSASSTTWDLTFAQLDARLFGELAGNWRGALGRPDWFTDVVYVAYIAYYFAPLIPAIYLYRRDGAGFRATVFAIVLTFYLSYVGYFLFPTLGPRVPHEAEALTLGGGSISDGIRVFLHFAERTQADAFPSGHTAVGLVSLWFAWYASPAVFAVLVPMVAGIIFSTVYLHFHYVVDVGAGAAVAMLSLWMAPRLELTFERRAMIRWMAVRLGID